MLIIIENMYIVAMSLIIVALVLVVELGTKLVVDRLRSNVVFEEFPNIEESDLQKFSSFDSELGWERQPNETRKKDTGHAGPDNPDANRVVYSTDAYGSRVCKIDRAAGEYSIATYGDSYCFCREVNDNETFQHFLSKDLGIHVSNYGVGNYGLGQSLLRMKRRFKSDPADFVVVSICDKSAFDRILSIWKHYYEFGNTFAVKPRYKLHDSELQVVPTPLSERSDLLQLKNHAEYLRSNDYHYENWFKSHRLNRPYLTYWLQSRNNSPLATFAILEHITRRMDFFNPTHKYAKNLKGKWDEKKRLELALTNQSYRNNLENEHMDLFCEILREFRDFANSMNSTPIFLPIRHPDYYLHEDVDPLNKETIDKIQAECPHLHIIDPRDDIFERCDDPKQLYTSDSKVIGHPSRRHNQLNAEFLAKKIQNIRQKSLSDSS